MRKIFKQMGGVLLGIMLITANSMGANAATVDCITSETITISPNFVYTEDKEVPVPFDRKEDIPSTYHYHEYKEGFGDMYGTLSLVKTKKKGKKFIAIYRGKISIIM